MPNDNDSDDQFKSGLTVLRKVPLPGGTTLDVAFVSLDADNRPVALSDKPAVRWSASIILLPLDADTIDGAMAELQSKLQKSLPALGPVCTNGGGK